MLPAIKKLTIDGDVGKIEKSKTIAAIKEFQSKVVKMATPDGRVDAKKVKIKYRIPASILIAQAALESGWGLSVKDNAYFGIKSHNSKGAATVFTTSEVINGKKVTIKDSFRAYANFGESAEDYGNFLSTQPRYKPCLCSH